MIQEMTSYLGSAELRYNRSRAASFQRHGTPPKIMPQSDISFHNAANCESIDLLMRQSNSGLGSRQKNLTTLIPTPESVNFSFLTLTPLLTPPSASGLSNVFALYQIFKHEKTQAVFPHVETILRLFLCLMVTNCIGERSFSKLKRIKSRDRPIYRPGRYLGFTDISVSAKTTNFIGLSRCWQNAVILLTHSDNLGEESTTNQVKTVTLQQR